jgi:hypothetical protein
MNRISREQARNIALKYLAEKKRDFEDVDQVSDQNFFAADLVTFGEKKGQSRDVWSVGYGVLWGFEIRTHFINIDAETGEVLYTISPHGYLEEMEDEE